MCVYGRIIDNERERKKERERETTDVHAELRGAKIECGEEETLHTTSEEEQRRNSMLRPCE